MAWMNYSVKIPVRFFFFSYFYSFNLFFFYLFHFILRCSVSKHTRLWLSLNNENWCCCELFTCSHTLCTLWTNWVKLNVYYGFVDLFALQLTKYVCDVICGWIKLWSSFTSYRRSIKMPAIIFCVCSFFCFLLFASLQMHIHEFFCEKKITTKHAHENITHMKSNFAETKENHPKLPFQNHSTRFAYNEWGSNSCTFVSIFFVHTIVKIKHNIAKKCVRVLRPTLTLDNSSTHKKRRINHTMWINEI